jgi:fumarate hydratase class II
MALVTALNPAIGYDEASTVAKKALEDGKTVREVAVSEGYLTKEEANEVLDPMAMTERGILSEDGAGDDGTDNDSAGDDADG